MTLFLEKSLSTLMWNFFAKKPEFFECDKIENECGEGVFFWKEKCSHPFKKRPHRNGRANTMPVVAGQIVVRLPKQRINLNQTQSLLAAQFNLVSTEVSKVKALRRKANKHLLKVKALLFLWKEIRKLLDRQCYLRDLTILSRWIV